MIAGALLVGAAPEPSATVTVGADLPATSNHLNRPVAANSPQLAADPRDDRFLAMAHRIDGPDFGCALELSSDGGHTWAPAEPVRKLPEGIDKCYAPEVGFDGKGGLYFLFVGLKGPANVPGAVFLTTSRASGTGFSAPRRILGPYSFTVRMAVEPRRGPRGRLHVVWTAANGEPGLGSMPPGPNPIFAMHSDDGGRSWSRPVPVSDPGRSRVVAPALALGPHGAVHVLYYDLADDDRDYRNLEGPVWDGTWSLVLASSDDDGSSFRAGVVVEPAVVPTERVILIFTMPPAALATGPKGAVYVAWHDARNHDWDVFLRRSSDAGRSWSAPERLNDDPEGDGRHQYQPRLAVAPGGRLDAVFYDRRADPENLRNRLAFTYSTDGGRHFAPDVVLSSRPSDPRIGQTYLGAASRGLVDFGSRLGLSSSDGRAVAAWTDTRNSVRAVQQDVFATVVVFGPAPRRGGGSGGLIAAWLLAGAAVGSALLIGAARRRRARIFRFSSA